jgi:ATP-dependent 26S proteasome regulatory subunit
MSGQVHKQRSLEKMVTRLLLKLDHRFDGCLNRRLLVHTMATTEVDTLDAHLLDLLRLFSQASITNSRSHRIESRRTREAELG